MGWSKGIVGGLAYCDVGGHFVAAGAPVWRFWTTPILATRCVCERCAGEYGREAKLS